LLLTNRVELKHRSGVEGALLTSVRQAAVGCQASTLPNAAGSQSGAHLISTVRHTPDVTTAVRVFRQVAY